MSSNAWALVIVMAASAALFIFSAPLSRLIVRLLPSSVALLSPPRITVEPVERLSWPDQDGARRLFQEFIRLGFVHLGAFRVREMRGVELVAFLNSDESAYGVLYHHARAGMWSDIVCYYEDGGALTVTNSPSGGVLEKPAGKVTLAVRGGSVGEMWSRFLAYHHPTRRRPLSGPGFGAAFESAYDEEMAWRRHKGGASEEEVRRVAANTGMMASEEDIRRVVEIEKTNARKKGL